MAQEIVDQGEGMAVDSVMEAEEDRKRNGVPENLNILKMKRLLLSLL